MLFEWKAFAGFILLTGICSFSIFSAQQKPEQGTQVKVEEVYRSIRSDNQNELGRFLIAGATNISNSQKTTPLHYAALYGSLHSMTALLAAGADPNARDLQESTPLIYAAYNAAKTRLLVEHGAQVNVRNHVGATPLIVAASAVNNSATVKYLLDKGAIADADADQGRALLGAAGFGDQESVKALLAHGASAKRTDKAGNNGLMAAMNLSSEELTNLFLTAGSDVNASNTFAGAVKNGPIALTHLTPLMLAAPYAKPEITQALLRSGARVNDVDGRKMSPLMLAVSTDKANPETVKSLIAAGADVNQKDRNGESVLDWALKFENADIISELRQAGAKEAQKSPAPVRPADYRPENVNTALTKSHALLATSGQKFFSEGGGCWGCHHQPMDARAYAASRDAGLPVDEHLKKVLLDSVIANRPRSYRFFSILADTGGDMDPLLSALTALADLHEPAGPDTDVMIHYIAARQLPSGAWNNGGIARPPIEESGITRTAAAVRVLTVYGWPARHKEFEERIQRGRLALECYSQNQLRTRRPSARLVCHRRPQSCCAASGRCASQRARKGRGLGADFYPELGRIRHRYGPSRLIHFTPSASVGSRVSTRSPLSSRNSVPGRVLVCTQPGAEVPALFPKRLPIRTRSVDFKHSYGLGRYGARACSSSRTA